MTSEISNSTADSEATAAKANLWAVIGLLFTVFFMAFGFFTMSTSKIYVEPYESHLRILGYSYLGIAVFLLIGTLMAFNKNYSAARTSYMFGGVLSLPLGIVMILASPADEGILYFIGGILSLPLGIVMIRASHIMKAADRAGKSYLQI